MKEKISLLIIVTLIFMSVTLIGSYAYFGANVKSDNVNDFNVITGGIDLKVDDESVSVSNISPVYDKDYKYSYDKEFKIKLNSTLNACTKIYLNVDEISDGLKSEYFKYKLVYDDKEIDGNFKEAIESEKMLLADNVFIEGNTTKGFNLYIWVSYQDDVDQTGMLGGYIKSSLFVKGIDIKEESMCR